MQCVEVSGVEVAINVASHDCVTREKQPPQFEDGYKSIGIPVNWPILPILWANQQLLY